MLLEKEYSIDDHEIKQYFSLDSVIEKMLAIYEEVLSLEFHEVPKDQIKQGKQTWHEQVRLFEVLDKTSKDLVGHFYLDLHPRDNKYTHAAGIHAFFFPFLSLFLFHLSHSHFLSWPP